MCVGVRFDAFRKVGTVYISRRNSVIIKNFIVYQIVRKMDA